MIQPARQWEPLDVAGVSMDCVIPHCRNLGSLFSTTPELLRKQRKDEAEGVKLQVAGVRDGPDLELERMKVGMWIYSSPGREKDDGHEG
jgi:hypothetical protein